MIDYFSGGPGFVSDYAGARETGDRRQETGDRRQEMYCGAAGRR